MRFKKMGSEAALQAEEDNVNVHNLVHPGKTSITNYSSLGGYHCGYEDCRVYSTSQYQDKLLDHLYLKHPVWNNVLSSIDALTTFKFGNGSAQHWITIFGNTLFFLKFSRHSQYWELLNHVTRSELCPKLRYDNDAQLRYEVDVQVRYDD